MMFLTQTIITSVILKKKIPLIFLKNEVILKLIEQKSLEYVCVYLIVVLMGDPLF